MRVHWQGEFEFEAHPFEEIRAWWARMMCLMFGHPKFRATRGTPFLREHMGSIVDAPHCVRCQVIDPDWVDPDTITESVEYTQSPVQQPIQFFTKSVTRMDEGGYL